MVTKTSRTFSTTPSPAAHIVGLPEGVVLTSLRVFRSNHGQGLCVNLEVDGKVIGTLEDDGNGGGTWYRPSVVHAEGRAVVEALVAEWAAAGEDRTFNSEESLWNDLVEEALTARDLKRKGLHVSKGEPRRTVGDEDFSYESVEYDTYPHATVEHAVADSAFITVFKSRGYTHYWTGTEWALL